MNIQNPLKTSSQTSLPQAEIADTQKLQLDLQMKNRQNLKNRINKLQHMHNQQQRATAECKVDHY